MGAWGYKAIESDRGLDMLFHMENYYEEHENVNIKEIVKDLIEKNLIYNKAENYINDKTKLQHENLSEDE